MTDGKKFDRFGRYLILDHLVDGGMAKICRARFLGEQADKVVAIKMVQPQFSADESFKTMFMDEIKTTFGLLHPNIVQTYDYGLQNNQLFVAMEYCDGRNLKEYLEKLKERNFVFPVEISVYITIQACQGLHYAHTFTDKLTGKPANIVHRDISPHNIMLTFDGAIKVIDFGIAKSETNSEATQAGTIKGKLSYLAPEYLDGHELDPRYDLFAVGITLWEMLCSRKLFKASNDLAVLKKIQECKIPKPSSINPNVPEELDKIVLKALAKDRNKRYQNLEELGRALNKFLYSTYPDFNASDLSYFAKELFKVEIKKDRERMYEFGQIDIKPYIADMRQEGENGGGAAPVSEDTTKRKQKETVLDFGFEDKAEVEKNTMTNVAVGDKVVSPQDSTRSKKVKKLDMSETTRKTKVRRVKKKSSATRTRIKKDSRRGPNPIIYVAGIAVLALIGVYQFSPGLLGLKGAPKAVVSKEPVKTGTEVETDKNRNPSSNELKKPGIVQIKNFKRRKDKLFVNGKEIEVDILNKTELQSNANLVIRVERPGREHFVINNFSISPGQQKTIEVEATGIASYGYLMTSRSCYYGSMSFELFGEDRVEKIPIRRKPGILFPVEITDNGEFKEKEHEIFIQRSGQNIKKKIRFSISESKVVDLCKLL